MTTAYKSGACSAADDIERQLKLFLENKFSNSPPAQKRFLSARISLMS